MRKKFKRLYWLPPRGALEWFFACSDEEFRKKHPFGYFLLVILSLTVLLLPVGIYHGCTKTTTPDIGSLGAFLVGIGLFNFVSIIIRQYLGHLVSLAAFALGGYLIALGLGVV